MGLNMKQTVWFCLLYLRVIGNISVLKALDEFLSRQNFLTTKIGKVVRNIFRRSLSAENLSDEICCCKCILNFTSQLSTQMHV